jgi:hypothetical protein
MMEGVVTVCYKQWNGNIYLSLWTWPSYPNVCNSVHSWTNLSQCEVPHHSAPVSTVCRFSPASIGQFQNEIMQKVLRIMATEMEDEFNQKKDTITILLHYSTILSNDHVTTAAIFNCSKIQTRSHKSKKARIRFVISALPSVCPHFLLFGPCQASQIETVSLQRSQSYLKSWVCNPYMALRQPLLWARSRAARGKITVSGTPNCLNYCENFVLHTQFTNVTAARIIQPGGPRRGDPRFKLFLTWIWANVESILFGL